MSNIVYTYCKDIANNKREKNNKDDGEAPWANWGEEEGERKSSRSIQRGVKEEGSPSKDAGKVWESWASS